MIKRAYFLSLASVAPISSPLFRASMVSSSILARFSQTSSSSSALPGGITTTPSASATIRSPGLIVSGRICSGDVNSTGTFRAEARVKVFEPKDEDAFAKTYGDHVSRNDETEHHNLLTHWETHSPMLIDITKAPINNHALRTKILRPRTHQPAPARRVKPFGLRDEHYGVFLDSIGEVLGGFGSCGVVGVDHLDCVGWAEDFGFAGLLEGREHFEAVEVAAVGDIEFHEGVADL